jgi:hypothetical protein
MNSPGRMLDEGRSSGDLIIHGYPCGVKPKECKGDFAEPEPRSMLFIVKY